MVCPACKAEIPSDAKACMFCGSRLDRLNDDGTKKAPAWIFPAIIIFVALSLVGFAWNNNRLEKERSDRATCEMTANMMGTDPNDC